MNGTRYHIGIDVRGALRNWGRREARAFGRQDGSSMKLDELRSILIEHLAQGHEVIPVSSDCACDNWDWKKGCQGHRVLPADAAGESRRAI